MGHNLSPFICKMGITLHKTAKELNKILWVTNANKMKPAAAIILSAL